MKEQYQPSPEEINKAEKMLTRKQIEESIKRVKDIISDLNLEISDIEFEWHEIGMGAFDDFEFTEEYFDNSNKNIKRINDDIENLKKEIQSLRSLSKSKKQEGEN